MDDEKFSTGLWTCFICGKERGYMETDIINTRAYRYDVPGVLIQTMIIFCNDNGECPKEAKARKDEDILEIGNK